LRAALVPRGKWAYNVAMFGNYWETWKLSYEERLYDYNDMLFYAAMTTNYAPGRPKVIIVDEAQDMTGLMWLVLSKWSKDETVQEIRIVGDQDQALFMWSGARPDFLNHETIRPDQRFVLNQSHRVPRAVHALAMRWIKQIKNRAPVEYYPRDFEGLVKRHSSTWKSPDTMVRDIEKQISDGKTVMILTSCSYMLNPALTALRNAAIPFYNPYRRWNGAWNPLTAAYGTRSSDRLLSFRAFIDDEKPRDELLFKWEELDKFVPILKGDAFAYRGAKSELSSYMLTLTEEEFNSGGMTMNDMDKWFAPEAQVAMLDGDLSWLQRTILADAAKSLKFPLDIATRRGLETLRKKPLVIPSTIHASKGTEADVVYLFPDLSKLGYDRWANVATRAEAIRQYYVGITRSAQELYIMTPALRYYVTI
jgi:superfamily I DNA/RNA helicase